MKPVVFITANKGKHREVQRLLAGYDVRWARLDLPRPDTDELVTIAKARVTEAFTRLGEPVFLENTGLWLWEHGGAPGASFKRTWRELGEAGFAERFGGSRGVARVVVAYTDSSDPHDVKVFEGSIAGTLLVAPRGELGYGWDRLWLPDGYARTLAEMYGSSYAVNMRALPYLELADFLRGGGEGVYEAHVTVSATPDPAFNPSFRAACTELGVKEIAIELPQGATLVQPMTASFHRGALLDVQREVVEVARALAKRGFDVTRTKIEAHGRVHEAPETDEEALRAPRTGYFEYHLKLALDADADLVTIAACLRRHGAALSRNAHKQADHDGRSERFVTLRAYGVGRITAEERFLALCAEVDRLGLTVRNRIREYTVFDTNDGLDAGWLAS